MYLPQWFWGLPAIAVLPLIATTDPRRAYLPIAALLLVAVWMMGFRWGAQKEIAGIPVRVMTYNIEEWDRKQVWAIASEISTADPDIVCLQDAGGGARRLAPLPPHWNVVRAGEYVIATRFPITSHSIGTLSYGRRRRTYLRAEVEVDGTRVTVVTVHLLTSRNALSAFTSIHQWPRGVALMRADLDNRLIQARRIADDLRGVTGPLIITGDFNVPATSLVFRTLADIGLHNVFNTSGRGYGYTFGHASKLRHSFVRIDHILVNDDVKPIMVKAGGARASDHRPVIADLVLTR